MTKQKCPVCNSKLNAGICNDCGYHSDLYSTEISAHGNGKNSPNTTSGKNHKAIEKFEFTVKSKLLFYLSILIFPVGICLAILVLKDNEKYFSPMCAVCVLIITSMQLIGISFCVVVDILN